MLSVVTMCAKSPETCSIAPEVISTASDVATVRADLLSDLMLTCSADYAVRVFDWFETARGTPGMITNPDGSVDVWVFEAAELAA